MKKIISILSSLAIASSTVLTLVSCSGESKKKRHVEYITSLAAYAKSFHDEYGIKRWAALYGIRKEMDLVAKYSDRLVSKFDKDFIESGYLNTVADVVNFSFHKFNKVHRSYYLVYNFATGSKFTIPSKDASDDVKDKFIATMDNSFTNLYRRSELLGKLNRLAEADYFVFLKELYAEGKGCESDCVEKIANLDTKISRYLKGKDMLPYSKEKYYEMVEDGFREYDQIVAAGQAINNLPKSYSWEGK